MIYINNAHKGKLYKNELNHWVYDDEFVEWVKDNFKNYSSITDMHKSTNLSRYLIKTLRDEYDLKFTPKSKNDSNFKAVYQDYDWCYQKFMIEGLNHDEMAKEAKCTKRVIEKWCTEKHRLTQKYRQKNKQLNDIQHDLIIGSLLGDGHIDKREKQPIFIVSHAANQKDYLYWKYKILKDICNTEPSLVKGSVKYFKDNPKGYLAQDSYRINTRVQDSLLPYRNMSIRDLLDNLNEFSLSIWMLDDGCRSESNWSVCVASFSKEDIDYAIKLLAKKFDLNYYTYNHDTRYIGLRAKDSRALDDIILQNIPNHLDIIKYKITENDKIASPQKTAYINIDGEDVLLIDYCKNNNINYKNMWKYHKDKIKLVI